MKRILLQHGNVPWVHRYWWSGPYTISEAKHKWLAFPDYIPLHIDGVSFQITNGPAWMGITRDDIYIRRADGSLRSWGDGKSQPFHKADGAQQLLLPRGRHVSDPARRVGGGRKLTGGSLVPKADIDTGHSHGLLRARSSH